MNVSILGTHTTKFGELWDVGPRALAREAMQNALKNSGIEAGQIEALFVGNMLSGILGNQENLGSFFANELLDGVAAFKNEAACASGGMAMHNAVNSLAAGKYKTVMVLGIEKMTDHGVTEVTDGLMAAGSDEERQAGITFPGLYALMAKVYLQMYGVTEEELSSIPVKNHFHGALNPKAQFPFAVTLEQVMSGARIADPLKLLDCSPITDGAAALVITTDPKLIKKFKKPVSVVASQVATDTLALNARASYVSINATLVAGEKAFKEAGVKKENIHVAELHDCFSIAEAIALEDLGFSKRGRAAKDVTEGKFRLDGEGLVVNTSGGLKAAGHPVGATGIKQINEVVMHLREESGKRQVKGAKMGLTHNVGGSGAIAAVHIFSN